MSRFALAALALLAACQGDRQPPLETGLGLSIREVPGRRVIELDPARAVATEAACEEGEYAKREGAGWVCASLSADLAADPGLRERLGRLGKPSIFATARGCSVVAGAGNHAWKSDCITHTGASAEPVELRCPIVSPETPAFSQLVLWTDDPELGMADASTIDVALLAVDEVGVFDGRGLQRVPATEVRATGTGVPQRVGFTPLAGTQALELSVVLRTDPAAVLAQPRLRTARFCAFGLASP